MLSAVKRYLLAEKCALSSYTNMSHGHKLKQIHLPFALVVVFERGQCTY